MKNTGILFFIVSILFSSASSKTIDIVDTKDKSIYKGTITEEDTATVVIELEGGSLIRIPRANILKIRHNVTEKKMEDIRHDGFFLTMNVGPGFGFYQWKRSNSVGSGTASISTNSVDMDFKIGGTVWNNLILSFDLLMNFGLVNDISGNGVNINGLGLIQSPDTVGLSNQGAIGLGATYYFMPHNIFLNGTVGLGNFSVQNTNGLITDEYHYYTRRTSDFRGLFLQLKMGKEWWFFNHWLLSNHGFGFSGTYAFFSGKEAVDKAVDPSYRGSIFMNRFGLTLTMTTNQWKGSFWSYFWLGAGALVATGIASH